MTHFLISFVYEITSYNWKRIILLYSIIFIKNKKDWKKQCGEYTRGKAKTDYLIKH